MIERIRKSAFDAYDKAISLGYKLEVENRQNLSVIRQNPNDPCVLYFNHTAMDDPFLIIELLQKEAPNRLKNVVMPVSDYYSQFKNYPAYSLSVKVGKMGGFIMPNIIQSYRRRGADENSDLRNKVESLNLYFTRLIKQRLTSGSCVIISPEGHRSPTSSLLPAESGAGLMVKMMDKLKRDKKIDNGYIIPIGIIFDNPKGPKLHYNPLAKAKLKLKIGEAMDPTSIINESSSVKTRAKSAKVASHILMRHLAILLPEEMRGLYSDEYFSDTLKGRYESRMDKNGKVYTFDNGNLDS
jgi:1-acyl-sn-glycerol-3-phosphate acyltransferase